MSTLSSERKKTQKDTKKLENFVKVQEQTRRRVLEVDDIIGDLVEDFRVQRIKSDQERERELKKLRDQNKYEKRERERTGAEAWFDYRNEQLKKEEAEKKKSDSYDPYYDISLRNEIRKEKQQEKAESLSRHEEYEKMRQRWREEDERRHRERAEDEKRDRENAWSRTDVNRKILNREKEEASKELQKREEQRAYEKELRENKWKMQQERDFSVEQDLDRILEKNRREKTRRMHRNEFAPTGDYISRSDFRDLEANSRFREASRTKGHTSSFYKRIKADEESLDDLKRWYNNRDLDRSERHHRTIRQIYS